MTRHRTAWPDSPAWTPATRLWIVSVVAIVGAIAWWPVREFTSIVVLGALLAYMMNPFVSALQRDLRLRRGLSAVIAYFVLIAVLMLIPIVIAPGVMGTLSDVDVVSETNTVIEEVVRQIPAEVRLFGRTFNLESQIAELQAESSTAIANLFAEDSLVWLLGLASDIAFTLFGLLVTVVVALYISIDTPGIMDWLERIVPPGYEAVARTMREDIDTVWRRFFRGQLVLALVVGGITTVSLLVLGLPYAVPLGVLAGVLEVVPRLGPILATFPAMAIALVSESTTLGGLEGFWLAIVVGILYMLIQNLENNFLVPRILGGSVNLPPEVVLVGALAGAKMAGVVGILLAAPVLGSLRVVGGWLHHQVTRREQPPMPIELDSQDWQTADRVDARPTRAMDRPAVRGHDPKTTPGNDAGRPDATSDQKPDSQDLDLQDDES